VCVCCLIHIFEVSRECPLRDTNWACVRRGARRPEN
jgi:hypothetical protein